MTTKKIARFIWEEVLSLVITISGLLLVNHLTGSTGLFWGQSYGVF